VALPRYWFPAKRYGWGWGPPRTWQGWLVLAVFFAVLVVGAAVFLPAQRPVAFVAYTAILSGALIAVCYATGEPPRWRWGKK
jgi:lipoprotein signal peptidase